MLRASLSAQCVRAIASTSQLTTSSFHTSAFVQAEAIRKRNARAAKKKNIAKKAERERISNATRPHIVLGTRPNEDLKWNECELAKIIVTPEQAYDAPPPMPQFHTAGQKKLPVVYNFGVGEEEAQMLFEDLPTLSAESASLRTVGGARSKTGANSVSGDALYNHQAMADKIELNKMNNFGRVVDLRNANAKGILFENKRRVVAAFSDPGKPGDTGRPEVQAAILTLRIRNIWEHLLRWRKDVNNRQGLRHLVHQRAKILKYLKRLDGDRYYALLPRLALEPEAVEGELVI